MLRQINYRNAFLAFVAANVVMIDEKSSLHGRSEVYIKHCQAIQTLL